MCVCVCLSTFIFKKILFYFFLREKMIETFLCWMCDDTTQLWLKIFILVVGVIKGIGIFVKWTDVFESVYELIEVCTKTVLSIILNLSAQNNR